MKTPFSSKTLIALAVAVAAAAGYKSLANEQPIPPPTTESALPASIPLGSPAGQVFKLVQAGVDVSVINSYILNCPTSFSLDADKIIALTDAGVSSEMVSAMFAHDKTLPAPVAAAPAAPVAAPNQPAAPVTTAEAPPPPTAPPTDLDLNAVSQTLTPYGSWVEIDGYGRCWRPSVVVYDSGWRPYCDRGRWVYTDCGWYWDSDYAWGVTFHYGRWFNQPGYGWCWWPDRVWAPSWVTWRSDNSYCGWAPLPPYTAYQTGIGFTYHGSGVAVDFGFGLASSCFTFVTIGNFCEHHPRYYCASPQQVTQIYNQTTIINNYNYNNNNHCLQNNGVSVTVIGNGGHHPIQQVPVHTFMNGGNRGWHGQNVNMPGRHFGSDASDGSGNRQFTGAGSHGDSAVQNPAAPTSSGRHDQRGYDSTAQNDNSPQRTPPTGNTPGNRHDQQGTVATTRDGNTPSRSATTVTTTANPTAPVATGPTRNQPQNNWINTARDNRQNTRPTTPPVAATPAPAQSTLTRPNNWGANNNQQSQLRSDFREQSRQAYSAPVYTAPPVAVQRPQNSEARQNYTQSAPRYVAPSAPAMSAPAQNQSQSQPQNSQSQNGNGRLQNWMAKNH